MGTHVHMARWSRAVWPRSVHQKALQWIWQTVEERTVLAYVILACLLLRLLQPGLNVSGPLSQMLDHGFLHGLHGKAQD